MSQAKRRYAVEPPVKTGPLKIGPDCDAGTFTKRHGMGQLRMQPVLPPPEPTDKPSRHMGLTGAERGGHLPFFDGYAAQKGAADAP